jgi:hypothetical protein
MRSIPLCPVLLNLKVKVLRRRLELGWLIFKLLVFMA